MLLVFLVCFFCITPPHRITKCSNVNVLQSDNGFKGCSLKRNTSLRTPLLTLLIFLFLFLFQICPPSCQACGRSDDLKWVYWSGDRARRGPPVWSQSDSGMGYKGALPRLPFRGYYTGSSVGCGNGWPPSASPHHHRGQSPSNKSSTPSKVIIDKEWHANVDTGEIILWGQSLPLSRLWRGRPCLMYKYCGGTLFPYLLSDYKRNGVETIRDAGSHVSFL